MSLNALVRILIVGAALVGISPQVCGQITILGVTSAADFVSGRPRPGALGSMFRTGLTNITGTITAEGAPLPQWLADVSVTIDQVRAPLLAIADLGGYQIINFQVPWEVAQFTGPPSFGGFVVQQGSERAYTAGVENAGWGTLFVDSAGYAVAQHASDYTRVTPDNPARRSEWIMAYATNLGEVKNPPPSGVPAPLAPLSPLVTTSDHSFAVALTSGGQRFSAQSNYMGLMPGTVGVYQVNLQIPASYPGGDAALQIVESRFSGFFFSSSCPIRGITCETISVAAKLPIAN